MAKGQALINEITAEYMKNDVPEFRPGDSVKVHVKIVECNTHRIQVFEGLVIKRQGAGISETFTVRKISYGVGVERTFPVNAPVIDKIEVTRRGLPSVLRNLTFFTARVSPRRARSWISPSSSALFRRAALGSPITVKSSRRARITQEKPSLPTMNS